jgi:hypothetical protein
VYSKSFFRAQTAQSTKSGEKVVPLILNLFQINSVIDYGCGTGSWLKSFQENGVKSIKGYDGHWVDPSNLQIPTDSFVKCDFTKDFKVTEKADLAVSLEVAEHLDQIHAENFISILTQTSDLILFSAAIPFQGGTHHVNEKWPEYWAAIFSKYGFVPADYIRPLIWNDHQVEFWFAQNILIYVKEASLGNYPQLSEYVNKTNPNYLTKIHPKHYLKNISPIFKLKNRIKDLF